MTHLPQNNLCWGINHGSGISFVVIAILVHSCWSPKININFTSWIAVSWWVVLFCSYPPSTFFLLWNDILSAEEESKIFHFFIVKEFLSFALKPFPAGARELFLLFSSLDLQFPQVYVVKLSHRRFILIDWNISGAKTFTIESLW